MTKARTPAGIYIIAFVLLALVMVSSSIAIALPLYLNPASTTFPDATLDNAESLDTIMSYIEADKTNEIDYSETDYNCVDFSWDTMRALNAEGIEARMLVITYVDESKHSVVIAPSEQGWVIIEPQSDEIINPEIGKTECVQIPLIYGIHFLNIKTVAKMEVITYDFVDLNQYIGNGSIYEK